MHRYLGGQINNPICLTDNILQNGIIYGWCSKLHLWWSRIVYTGTTTVVVKKINIFLEVCAVISGKKWNGDTGDDSAEILSIFGRLFYKLIFLSF